MPNNTMARHDETIRGGEQATFIALAAVSKVCGDEWLLLPL
jgi:hypothetical protein